MDKLNNLPPQQKVLIVVAALGIVAGGFYQLVISDLRDELVGARVRLQRSQTEFEGLRQYEQRQRLESVQTLRAEEQQRLEDNKRMLPGEHELPTFIMSIKADADRVGLDVLRFEPGEPEVEDYYKRIPVRVEVLGRSPQLVEFLQTLAEPRKRIVNVRELDIERLPIDLEAIQRTLGGQSAFDQAARLARRGEETRDMTNEERRMVRLQRWQLANEMNVVRATFTAYTFSYTGEPMPEDVRRRRRAPGRRG